MKKKETKMEELERRIAFLESRLVLYPQYTTPAFPPNTIPPYNYLITYSQNNYELRTINP